MNNDWVSTKQLGQINISRDKYLYNIVYGSTMFINVGGFDQEWMEVILLWNVSSAVIIIPKSHGTDCLPYPPFKITFGRYWVLRWDLQKEGSAMKCCIQISLEEDQIRSWTITDFVIGLRVRLLFGIWKALYVKICTSVVLYFVSVITFCN